MVTPIRRASEPETIQYWLEREYKTRDWVRTSVGFSYRDWISLISRKDFDQSDSNRKRFLMLSSVRPFIPHFERGGLFSVSTWNLVRIGLEDLERLILINAGDRREMSGGTLKPFDAARRIEDDVRFVDDKVQKDADYIRNNAEKLALDPSRIVVVGTRKGMLTVVDGVHRITAIFLHYFVRKKGTFDSREAYHGISKSAYDYRFS